MTAEHGRGTDCSCGCREGVESPTPLPTANRPGLRRLAYRAGTHASFYGTMRANLSATGPDGTPGPLTHLVTRSADDPSLALLDAWATVADVLTFYQERIANEGYLATATERRSVVELARLIGYRPRPGVAATAYLAFTMQDGTAVTVPPGTRAQSVPGPGELPQSFETTDALPTRAEWNILRPRLTAPQVIEAVADVPRLYLAGTSTGLSSGDLLVLVKGSASIARVKTVAADTDHDRTLVTLENVAAVGAGTISGTSADAGLVLLTAIVTDLMPAACGVNAGSRTAVRAWETLSRLGVEAVTAGPDALHDAIEDTYLPGLRAELEDAGTAPLRRWLGTVVARLERARDELAAAEAGKAPRGGGGAGGTAAAAAPGGGSAQPLAPVTAFDLAGQLLKPPSTPPPSPQRLGGTVAARFAPASDTTFRVLGALRPVLAETLLPAWEGIATGGVEAEVYALRLTTGLFGHDVPRQFTPDKKQQEWLEWDPAADEDGKLLYLDAAYPQVKKDGWVVVEKPAAPKTPGAAAEAAPSAQLWRIKNVATRPRSAYGLNGVRTTVIEIAGDWWTPNPSNPEQFKLAIRGTTLHTGSERLALAEAPLPPQFPASGDEKNRIPLDGLYGGLEPGRWLIATGDRVLRDQRQGEGGDIVAMVPAAELVMLAGVEHATSATIPGDTPHTTLVLAAPLAYEYQRASLAVHANVAKSTHGETHVEVLGSGDSSAALQSFPLTYSPLTYVSSADPSGAVSTLEVRVNGVRWHEREEQFARAPTDRGYLSHADAELVSTVTFGDGVHGARVPTGSDNIEARYRSQIGQQGNVAAGRISLLATTPEGASSVINPLPASGGADPESRDQIRTNAPLAITALDRLVSVRDYEDFSRTFAGIGKALAVRRTDGAWRRVHVTVAGADDAPLTPQSDTYVNLFRALRTFGDPGLPVRLDVRDLLLLVIDAGIGVQTDYAFDRVEPKIRAALVGAFGFAHRELGQDVYSSEVISVIQSVEGVAFVDLNKLGVTSADRNEILDLAKLGEPPARIDVFPPVRRKGGAAGAANSERAELAIIAPTVPETVLLREVP
ncbi:putative baseplate assembly protein [Streptomyces sp. NPDC001530]|uniref:putative baseplate assembly protein n=1 Tax=Streptomyces sp. NPDC001530 TaxID=3364582 RepID=UPI00368359B7